MFQAIPVRRCNRLCHHAPSLSQAPGRQPPLGGDCDSVGRAARHQGPGDPCHLVRQRDGNHLPRSSLHQSLDPVRGLENTRVQQRRVRSDDQQTSDMLIAFSRYPAKPILSARRVLAWCQPEPRRKLQATLKHARVGDGCRDRSRCQRANARNAAQPPANFISLVPG